MCREIQYLILPVRVNYLSQDERLSTAPFLLKTFAMDTNAPGQTRVDRCHGVVGIGRLTSVVEAGSITRRISRDCYSSDHSTLFLVQNTFRDVFR